MRATDNGTPPLTRAASISVIVNEVNQPPALAPIADRSATIGETVSFNVSATDGDLPVQRINFDYAVVPPAGAALGATNGLFTWTANNVGTNTFTVRATDNWTPSQSAQRTFSIVVAAAQLTTTVALSNDAASSFSGGWRRTRRPVSAMRERASHWISGATR